MNKIMIIAEAGVNHNGDIKLAKKLIEQAAACGADAVKFQAFRTQSLVTQDAKKADYQIASTEGSTLQFEMLKKLELKEKDYKELLEYCKLMGIAFMCSPFDLESIEILNTLGMNVFKIPSGEITNYPYLKKIADLKKEIILSTGMSHLDEIKDAIDILKLSGQKLTLLHCTTQYPTPMQEVNLRAMLTMQQNFQLEVGYSDHTQGIEVAIAAAALGACIIEKHFTLDRTMPGPDHKASLEPKAFKSLVKSIRNIEQALGTGIKEPTVSEMRNRACVRKSIVSKKAIKKGEVFNEKNLCIKRPGTGISPMRFQEILGQVASRDYKEDELISL
ncbi:N-acetylneuraminate synthase [Cellulosilyticum sp. I15G10I2]|uniref:N-acetylneuraminate synthase n=1 Tax=Cellulosilyticum sp. I15G10I2 TaxID=1892843 RepID=UPI00085C2E11|nr:N-acetylneuraminate synthase [Cellulosilyticum sp. I15G10I2]